MDVRESWTTKKAEHWRIDAFELWCWRRLLRVTWTARRSNQSILKETNPDYSLEDLMLKLKLQTFGHMMQRADPLEKILMLGERDWRQEVKGMTEDKMDAWHHWLNGHEFEHMPGDGEWEGSMPCRSPWGHKESDMTEQWNSKEILAERTQAQTVFLWSDGLFIIMIFPRELSRTLALFIEGMTFTLLNWHLVKLTRWKGQAAPECHSGLPTFVCLEKRVDDGLGWPNTGE